MTIAHHVVLLERGGVASRNAELRDRLGHEAAKTARRDVRVVAPTYLAHFEDLMAGG
jgi:hypothetical protein